MRRLAVLDTVLARGIAELDAGQGQDASRCAKHFVSSTLAQSGTPRQLRDSGTQGRRRAAWAFALLAHALIIWALLQGASPLPRQRAAIERMTLVYLPPPDRAAPATALPPHPQPTPPPLAAQRPSRTTTYAAPAAPGETAPAPAPSQQPQPPAIDWAAEQDRVAESQARAHWTELSQHCRDAAALHIYPPECHRYIEPKPWEPEEKRFGMAGPLPYVRAGPCVVGLGFWRQLPSPRHGARTAPLTPPTRSATQT
jgi:hypothetical protein